LGQPVHAPTAAEPPKMPTELPMTLEEIAKHLSLAQAGAMALGRPDLVKGTSADAQAIIAELAAQRLDAAGVRRIDDAAKRRPPR
jgi:hypothetical protein